MMSAMIVVSSPGSTGLGMCMLKPAASARSRSCGRPVRAQRNCRSSAAVVSPTGSDLAKSASSRLRRASRCREYEHVGTPLLEQIQSLRCRHRVRMSAPARAPEEPSSGLDSESERLVFEGLDRLSFRQNDVRNLAPDGDDQNADVILVPGPGPHRRARHAR